MARLMLSSVFQLFFGRSSLTEDGFKVVSLLLIGLAWLNLLTKILSTAADTAKYEPIIRQDYDATSKEGE